MLRDVTGFHHVTGLAGDPGVNGDFSVERLGLRFLERTVNHEDRALIESRLPSLPVPSVDYPRR
ncbi:hypothetical protein [Halalkalicoccus tibetensis]|uniref:Transposase n=1 Tax=Halalkalicoccus tibetensis TaxID=175632 RepID=A0ABD5V707_9EURY